MPIFETERLYVRPWTLAAPDIAWAHRMYSDPCVVRHIGGWVMADPAATRAHIRMRLERRRRWGGRFGSYAAQRKSDGAVIGNALIKPLRGATEAWTSDIEIGWHLARAEWGRGYATEIGRGLLAYAAHIGVSVVHVVAEAYNERSLAVARRIGVVYRGVTTEYYDGIELAHFTTEEAASPSKISHRD